MKLRKLWPIAALISLVFLLAAPAAFGAVQSHIQSDSFEVKYTPEEGQWRLPLGFLFKSDGTFRSTGKKPFMGEWFFIPFISCIVWTHDDRKEKYVGAFFPYTTQKAGITKIDKRTKKRESYSTGFCELTN